MRSDYTRMVEIANQGAKELGYADTGAMWRSQYDMTPEEFSAMYDRLWAEMKPLYDQLHCYTRTKLNQKYGDAVQPATGPIRADLLGNMWAQEWGNIYDVVAPKGAGDIGYDLDRPARRPRSTRRRRWSKAGEGFYTSLGFAPLPASFWTRSQIIAPARPRSHLPRLGLGRRQQGRSAHQDVHQGQCRRLRHHPPRAWPQFLPARLQPAAVSLSERRQ